MTNPTLSAPLTADLSKAFAALAAFCAEALEAMLPDQQQKVAGAVQAGGVVSVLFFPQSTTLTVGVHGPGGDYQPVMRTDFTRSDAATH